MLQIRAEQMRILEAAAIEVFEDRTLEHLKEFAPRHVEVMGESGARRFIRLGMERAKSLGFATERDTWLYIDLMILLGSSFDTDPQLPWVAEVFNGPRISSSALIEHLHQKAGEYLERVAGPENEFVDAAVARMLDESARPFLGSPGVGLESELAERLRRIYPEKCTYLGDDRLRKLIYRGVEVAQEQNIASVPGIAVSTALMFMLGSGVFADPQFPWVSAAVNDPSQPDRDQRVKRLYLEGVSYLRRCLP